MQTEDYLEEADLDDIKRFDIQKNIIYFNQNFKPPTYFQHNEWNEIHNNVEDKDQIHQNYWKDNELNLHNSYDWNDAWLHMHSRKKRKTNTFRPELTNSKHGNWIPIRNQRNHNSNKRKDQEMGKLRTLGPQSILV